VDQVFNVRIGRMSGIAVDDGVAGVAGVNPFASVSTANNIEFVKKRHAHLAPL
jgi:hypothetical protein